MVEELKACPCPFCGDTPGEDAHTLTDGGFKYGAIQCSCGAMGPDVRTEYKDWPHWKDAAIREWNTRADLPCQGGEAVEVVASIAVDAEGVVRDFTLELGLDRHPGGYTVTPLMTVAQHQRILAAATHSADQVAEGVRLDGLVLANLQMGRVYLHFKTTEQQHAALRELRALLNGGRS